MDYQPDFEPIRAYFADKLHTYGASPRGADWNSEQAQEVRFEQLLRLVDPSRPFSLIDYGCGYAALADSLLRRGWPVTYIGYDLLPEMVAQARQRHAGRAGWLFTDQERELPAADYVVASGIFNIKLDATDDAWTAYVLATLDRFHQLSRLGFASNFLTSYSDAEYMKPHLYYADPCRLFDACKRRFARDVALLHDYTLYDFTLLVRKQPPQE